MRRFSLDRNLPGAPPVFSIMNHFQSSTPLSRGFSASAHPHGPGRAPCSPWTSILAKLPVLVVLLTASGCAVAERVEEAFRGETPRERYVEGLDRAGLDGTLLGSSWMRVGEAALESGPLVALPHREEGVLLPEEPTALSASFDLRRGEYLQVVFTRQEDGDSVDEAREWGSGSRVFIDLHRLRDPDRPTEEGGPRPITLAWSEAGSGLADTLVHEASVSGRYLARAQPELLAGGSFTLEIRSGPSMDFPVAGRTTRDIQSRFGAARDGGRREHHGVDIFAPRGTPVLAAGPGVVRRVNETPIGGKVVWVFDQERNLSRYYAHLDSQAVEAGRRVEPGDTLGTVGNTGNARTTPPHLHFGIYVRGEGPVDPWPYLYQPASPLPPVRVDPARFGTAGTVRADDVPVRIVSGSGNLYRVRTRGDGQHRHSLVPAEALSPQAAP
ncbi:MAG: M23 family metallopeptidase [Gemmatimonadales bacterium]|nr:MAG: M23 family metallopeptidase [Gemmatimonadales bacterium]